MEKQIADDMRQTLGDQGFIKFSIKAKNTAQSQSVHEAFKAFAKAECNDDYTLALQILLRAYEEDFKYASLREQIMELRGELEELKAKPVTADKESIKTF